MSSLPQNPFRAAIACGGTGGHFFPGVAVAEQLVRRGCDPTLLVSTKEVDRQVVQEIPSLEVVSLPAVGLMRGGELAFIRGFIRSYRAVKRLFKARPAQAVLAMGGFTSAPTILAGKRAGARTFLHESNAVPGRANRWLSRLVDGAFVGYPVAAGRLRQRHVVVTGTPVRSCFQARRAADCRAQLGLNPERPVLLVMGGSQGARGINELVMQSLPQLAGRGPEWQWIHLTGPSDAHKVSRAYAAVQLKAAVHPFLAAMDVVLAAATAAVCRAGASSLAELAAMRVPAVLVPYPAAADNHQFHNARALEATGAAYLLEERSATPEILVQLLSVLVEKRALYEKMQGALAQWHTAQAAEEIAKAMLVLVGAKPGRALGPDRLLASSSGADTMDAPLNLRHSRPLMPARTPRYHSVARQTTQPAGRGA